MDDAHIEQRPVARHIGLGHAVDEDDVVELLLRGHLLERLLAGAVAEEEEHEVLAAQALGGVDKGGGGRGGVDIIDADDAKIQLFKGA